MLRARRKKQTTATSKVVDIERMAIKAADAAKMKAFISPGEMADAFQMLTPNILTDPFKPAWQKGLSANGKYTCVGLVERAAEVAGVALFANGYVPDFMESSFSIKGKEFPFLSPELLLYCMKMDYAKNVVIDGGKKVIKGVVKWHKLI